MHGEIKSLFCIKNHGYVTVSKKEVAVDSEANSNLKFLSRETSYVLKMHYPKAPQKIIHCSEIRDLLIWCL